MSTTLLTDEEAALKIADLKEQHKDVLSTGLLSEGTISGHQVAIMSKVRRRRWEHDSQLRMVVEAEIRQLKRPYAVRLAELERRNTEAARGRAMQSRAQLGYWLCVSPGKRGMRPLVRKHITMYRDALKTEIGAYPAIADEFDELVQRCNTALG